MTSFVIPAFHPILLGLGDEMGEESSTYGWSKKCVQNSSRKT